MTSIIKVQNIQYTDGDAALTIADGGGVTAASTLTSTGAFTSPGIDDNANALAMTIDSAENIGIGTTPKSWHGNWTAIDLGDQGHLGHYDGGDTQIGTNMYHDGGWKAKENGTSSNYALGANGYHTWFGNPSANADASINLTTNMQLTIDGELLKPKHPCFRASGLGGAWSVGINDVVHFANDGNGFNFDQGNNYNTSSNGFFAPVAGKYQFYTQALVQNGTNQKRIKLRHNGTDFAIGNVYGYNSSSEVTVWVSGIVNCAANDKIDVHLNTQGGNYYNHHPYTFFQGFLIG